MTELPESFCARQESNKTGAFIILLLPLHGKTGQQEAVEGLMYLRQIKTVEGKLQCGTTTGWNNLH